MMTQPEQEKFSPGASWGRRAFEVAGALSFPRLVGTAGERVARERVKGFFERAGLAVDEEVFYCSDYGIRVAARWALAPSGVMLAVAALLLKTPWPGLAILFALGSILPAAHVLRSVSSGFRGGKGRAQYRCANVVGRLNTDANAKTNVVLMAHYDSKSQNFPIWLRVALFLLAGLVGLVLIILITACAAVLLLSAGCVIEPYLLPAAAAGLVLDLAFLLNRVGNLSDGAADNAASVGIITEIAARLAQENHGNVNLWVVATDAEEIGLCGSVAFLDAHRDELDPARTVILNFDGCGAGHRVDVLAAHGVPRKKAPAQLLGALRRVSTDLGIDLREAYIPFGMATDLFPLVRAGYPGIDLIGIHGFFHTTADRMDKIILETLAEYVRVGYEMVVRIANN